MRYDSSDVALRTYIEDNRRLTVGQYGGTLHGVWSSDVSLATSDRRLKTDVMPLRKTILDTYRGEAKASLAEKDGADHTTSASWVLRELRPVSFRLKAGPEAKFSRFGFIAQDLEKLFPDMVRTEAESGVRQVVYQDLIALLTVLTQAQHVKTEALEQTVHTQQESIAALQGMVHDLQTRLAKVERQLDTSKV